MKKKPYINIQVYIKQMNRAVFTTNELVAVSGKSSSAVTQALNNLARQGLINKVYRGIWAESGGRVSAYSIIPFLLPRQRVYVSFVCALHLYGIIEQIPRVITLASTAHTRSIKTALGTFAVHQITPELFSGFDWYRGGEGPFLIAEPEKALIDSLYLSAHKKKQFGHFPEMDLTKGFSFSKCRQWAKKIRSPRVRLYVERKLEYLKGA